MKIAICDDERICIEQVMAVATRYAASHADRRFTFDTFFHPEDLTEAAEKIGGYDIYILDVVMPGMNGISLGVKLREAGYDGKIIYLTSSSEYSLDAFRVRALDYLIKPIEDGSFFKAMDDAAALISEKKNKFLLVKARERSIKLGFDSILYADLNQRAINYHLSDGRMVESMTLRGTFTEAIADLLEDRRFNLCSVSMVVNLDCVAEIETDAVVFGNGCRAYLGEKYCRKLRSVWSEYLFNGEG